MKKQGILLTAAVFASLTAGSVYASGSNIGYNTIHPMVLMVW